MAKLSRLTIILALAQCLHCVSLLSKPSDNSLVQTESIGWGFTRNIINIDTFFKDPNKRKQELAKQKQEQDQAEFVDLKDDLV